MRIHDARSRHGVVLPAAAGSQAATLINGRGYLLAKTPSAVRDWNDYDHVCKVYYREAVALARALLPEFEWDELGPHGAHTIRREDVGWRQIRPGTGPTAPAVHNDFADDFVGRPLRDDGHVVRQRYVDCVAPEPGANAGKRLVILNLWRSVSPQPMARWPLAVCDKTSLAPVSARERRQPRVHARS